MTDETVTTEVIQLRPFQKAKKEEELILICRACECRSFLVTSLGRLECAHCKDDVLTDVEWRKQLPDVTGEEDKDDAGTFSIAALGDASFACMSVVGKIKKRMKELVAVHAVFRDTTTSAWNGAENAKERDALVVKIEEFAAHMKKGNYSD